LSVTSTRHPDVRRALVFVAALLVLGSLAVPSVAATGVTVRISAGLDPVELRIHPGTTVTFRNDDGARHRLRSRAGAEFDTGNIEPGRARSIRFTATGRYPYVDERDRDATQYHGTIVVTESGAAGSTGSGGAGPATTATIHFAGRRFSPSSVTVRTGAIVTFRNDDDREHTASATEGAFDTGILRPGGSRTVTLSRPGTYAYLCQIHPDMTGTITVTSAAQAAPAPTPDPTSQPSPSPTPTPTVSPTPGPTILEAQAAVPAPSDVPASVAPTTSIVPGALLEAGAVDTGAAGRVLLTLLLTGAAAVAFARVVAGTRR